MSDRPGVRINGRFYPYVDAFKHGDPILIHEVTGLDWDEFSEMLAKAGDGRGVNPIAHTAMIAVAIQREHKTWSRREVSDYIRDVDLGAEEIVGVEEPSKPEEMLPPPESASNSSSSDETSSTSAESTSAPNPTDSGGPGSDTTSQDLLRAV